MRITICLVVNVKLMVELLAKLNMLPKKKMNEDAKYKHKREMTSRSNVIDLANY